MFGGIEDARACHMLQERNFLWLLVALLVFLIANPVAEDLGLMSGRMMRGLFFSWLLAVGVWSLRGFGRKFLAGIVLALLGILLSMLAMTTASTDLAFASFAALIGFLLLAAWCTSS